jgi:hypothetical protein
VTSLRGRRRNGSGKAAVCGLLAATLTAACGSTVQQAGQPAGPGALNPDAVVSAEQPAADGLGPDGMGPAPDGVGTGSTSGPGPMAPDQAGVDSTAATAGGTGPAGRPGSGSPAQAGSAGTSGARDTSPITIGMVGLGSTSGIASSMGGDGQASFSIARAQKELVDVLNEGGGLAGRRIRLVHVELDPVSNSYEQDLQAACEKFTNDNKVSAVLSSVSITFPNFEECLTKAGVPHIETLYGGTDEASLDAWPGLVLPGALSNERRSTALLTALKGAGSLTSGNKLGVLVEDCPDQVAGHRRGFQPTAKRLGLNVAVTFFFNCIGGFDDIGGVSGQLQNAILQFRSEGVDRVLWVTSWEATLMLVFANSAESQGYRPGYGVGSGAAPSFLAEELPEDQRAGLRFAGWLPLIDTAQRQRVPEGYARCKSLAAKRNLSPTTAVEELYLGAVCDSLFLYEAVLSATGGNSSPSRVIAALPSVASAYASPNVLGSRIDMRSRRDGVAVLAAGGYDVACSCTRYTTTPARY